MSKQIKWRAEQINSSFSQTKPYVFSTRGQKIVSISITNLATSPYNLLIGLNEIPTSKIPLISGQSMPLGPYRTDDYANDNFIQFGWETADNNNRAVIVISYEGDNPINCEQK
jgi:hypothetical protein